MSSAYIRGNKEETFMRQEPSALQHTSSVLHLS